MTDRKKQYTGKPMGMHAGRPAGMSGRRPAGMTEEQKLLKRLREAPKLYTLVSLCTREPYVLCDPETYDDEILLFFQEEDAKEDMERLRGEQIPVSAAVLEKEKLLLFLSGLFTMGVNALLIREKSGKCRVQLEALVKRNIRNQQEGAVWIENPQLHLTALSLAQEMRRPGADKDSEEMKALQEELEADFRRGTFLAAVKKEEQGIVLVKLEDGKLHQPVFTDILEFQKFDKERQLRPVAVPADKLVTALAAEAEGVVLNPAGVRLTLMIRRMGRAGA